MSTTTAASSSTISSSRSATVTDSFQKSLIAKKSFSLNVENYLSFKELCRSGGWTVYTGKHNLEEDEEDGGKTLLSFQVYLWTKGGDLDQGRISMTVAATDVPQENRKQLAESVLTWEFRFVTPRQRAYLFPSLGYVTSGAAHLRTWSWNVKYEHSVPKDLSGTLEVQVDVKLWGYTMPFTFTRKNSRVAANAGGNDVDESNNQGYEPLSMEENAHLSDVKVICNKVVFKCHKIHLSRRSSVFQAMFQHPLEETLTNEVVIEDFDELTVGTMIKFIYEGEFDETECSEELLAIAEKYDIKLLKRCCESALADQLDDSSVAKMWVIADENQASILKDAVIKYLCDNWERREEFDDLEKVLLERPGLIKDLLPLISIK